LGVCEGLSSITIQGHKLYKCRFETHDSIINNGNDVIRVCYHMTGSFYFFELEEISHA
jgi:hypothetical protein